MMDTDPFPHFPYPNTIVKFKFYLRNPDLKYYFIPVLNMSLNFIQFWPEFILFYPQYMYVNFIHLSLQKINFIILSRNSVAPQAAPKANAQHSMHNDHSYESIN